jgi:hypothetical protein
VLHLWGVYFEWVIWLIFMFRNVYRYYKSAVCDAFAIPGLSQEFALPKMSVPALVDPPTHETSAPVPTTSRYLTLSRFLICFDLTPAHYHPHPAVLYLLIMENRNGEETRVLSGGSNGRGIVLTFRVVIVPGSSSSHICKMPRVFVFRIKRLVRTRIFYIEVYFKRKIRLKKFYTLLFRTRAPVISGSKGNPVAFSNKIIIFVNDRLEY